MNPASKSLRILTLAALTAAEAGATTLRVPSEYETINAALDAAAAGDSVLVAPGTYDQYETRFVAGLWISSVGFLKGGVTILSEAGASATVLRMDSTTGEPEVLYGDSQIGVVVIEGLTVTGVAPGIFGAGLANGGRLVVRDCVFDNLGTGLPDEGGVGSVRSDLEVYNCRFENINGSVGSAINQTSGTLILEDSEFLNCRSGAINLSYDPGFPHATGATVRRCRFVNNVQTHGASAGLNAGGYSNVLVEDCWFEGNESLGPSSGGAALAVGGPTSLEVEVRDNTFVGNFAERGRGGAVYVSGLSNTVISNSFSGNGIGLPWSQGGAALAFNSSGRLEQNVISGSSGAVALGVLSGTVTLGCNVFWDNPQGHSGVPLSATDLPADPMFCDPAGKDFRVNAASPCLPANGHPACTELIGAWGEGCGAVSLDPTSWGRIKGGFRTESEAGR